MRDLLLDADVFRFLRGLGLLDEVITALRADRGIVITEYVARHELSTLQSDVSRLEHQGALRIERLTVKSPAGQRYREFQRRADKGEAEAIAYATGFAPAERPVFVTRDDGARRFAAEQKVPCTDVMGIVVEAVLTGRVSRQRAAEALAIWDDKAQQLGRPSPYDSFEAAFAARERERAAWSSSDAPKDDEDSRGEP